MSNVAPISSTIDTATSAMISAFPHILLSQFEATLAPDPFRSSFKSVRETLSAGISPDINPVRAANTAVKASTRQFTPTGFPGGSSMGLIVRKY